MLAWNDAEQCGVVWQKCSKNAYVERWTFEIGVCSAILNFNSGCAAIIQVLESAGCEDEYFTRKFRQSRDQTRILNMNRKSGQPTMTQREKVHAKRKGLLDTNTAGEF